MTGGQWSVTGCITGMQKAAKVKLISMVVPRIRGMSVFRTALRGFGGILVLDYIGSAVIICLEQMTWLARLI